ncbi:MAG: ABC transporter permease [Candidatus Lernaella stagnicola]|nr:ABC transporter permease [Candidatus Lernaella stagnicola]
MRSPAAIVGFVLIALLVIAALIGPWIAPQPADALHLGDALEGPSAAHLLGQDELGRDLFSRLIVGARASALVGVIVVLISVVVGTIVGLLAGYLGGVVDQIVMRIVDVLLAFPGILLAIAVAGILGPSLGNVIFALSILGWTGFARLVRGQVLTLREREFVLAARGYGASTPRILWRHVLPNVLAPVLVQATFGMASVILAEASLSFLGLGPQNIPTWGAMLSSGVDYLLFAPHLSLAPGVAIMLTVLAFNFLGDALRDRLDPRSETAPQLV